MSSKTLIHERSVVCGELTRVKPVSHWPCEPVRARPLPLLAVCRSVTTRRRHTASFSLYTSPGPSSPSLLSWTRVSISDLRINPVSLTLQRHLLMHIFFYLTLTLILQHPVVTFPIPMGRVKFVLNLISFSNSLLGPIFYFYIDVSSSVLSYCSIKHDDDDYLHDVVQNWPYSFNQSTMQCVYFRNEPEIDCDIKKTSRYC